ncbi:MAG: hypothetical protein NTW29_03430 [Bacteroidetes bacterium]|nr:hypothetical protein [Bacteroidota bacterium]
MRNIYYLLCLLLPFTTQAQPGKSSAKAAPAPVSSTQIKGLVRGRAGTTIVLQLNNANDLTVKLTGGDSRFTFPKALPDGSTYRVTVKTQPANEIYAVKTYAGEPHVVSTQSFVIVSGDLKFDLVSRDTMNRTGTFYESWDPVSIKSLEDNARYVVFTSQAKGLCGASGKFRQVYWRDRITGETRMLSRAPNGEEGNGNSFVPVISVGSIYVAFESYASNLVGNDGNGVRDVFLWRKTQTGGEIERVSESALGVEGNSESFEPTISGMGGQVAYSSNASNLLDDGTEVSGVNVYLWDRNGKTTTLLSKDPKTGKGVGGSKPSIDMNGYRVAFWSWAWTLDPNDKNNIWDIFLYERNSSLIGQPLRRITMAWDGSERNQGDESSSRVVTPYISGDGRFISYATTASNVVPDDNNKTQDAFVYDIENNRTTRISVNNNGEEGNGSSPTGQGERIELSYDGSVAAFTTTSSNFGMPPNNIVSYHLPTKKLTPVTNVTGTYVSTPSLSRSGRYVVFGCGQPLDTRFSSSGLFAAFTGIGD